MAQISRRLESPPNWDAGLGKGGAYSGWSWVLEAVLTRNLSLVILKVRDIRQLI